MATYKLHPRAVADLRSIRRWISNTIPNARAFILELTEHFQKLAEQKNRHRILLDLGPVIRRAAHGNYNIYYRRIGPDDVDVVIVRVLHAARDLSQIVVD